MASADLPQEAGATAGFDSFVVGRKSKPGIVGPGFIGNHRDDPSSWIYKMNFGEYGGQTIINFM